MKLRREEISRKGLHLVFGALIPAVILYAPACVEFPGLPPGGADWVWPAGIFAVSTLLLGGAEFLRFRVRWARDWYQTMFGSFMREEEAKRTTGATYISASALICVLVLRNHLNVAAMVLWMFIWGDAVAALVGQSIGRIRIAGKSLEGSLSCFLLCLALVFGLFPFIPGMMERPGGGMGVVPGVLVALMVTVQELFPLKWKTVTVNDNLTVPVVTGAAVVWLFPLFGGM